MNSDQFSCVQSTAELLNTIQSINEKKDREDGQDRHDPWIYCRTGHYVRCHVIMMRGAIVMVAYQYIYSPAFIAIQWTNPHSYMAYYFNGFTYQDIEDGYQSQRVSRMLSVMIASKHQFMWLKEWYPYNQPWCNAVSRLMSRSSQPRPLSLSSNPPLCRSTPHSNETTPRSNGTNPASPHSEFGGSSHFRVSSESCLLCFCAQKF